MGSGGPIWPARFGQADAIRVHIPWAKLLGQSSRLVMGELTVPFSRRWSQHTVVVETQVVQALGLKPKTADGRNAGLSMPIKKVGKCRTLGTLTRHFSLGVRPLVEPVEGSYEQL